MQYSMQSTLACVSWLQLQLCRPAWRSCPVTLPTWHGIPSHRSALSPGNSLPSSLNYSRPPTAPFPRPSHTSAPPKPRSTAPQRERCDSACGSFGRHASRLTSPLTASPQSTGLDGPMTVWHWHWTTSVGSVCTCPQHCSYAVVLYRSTLWQCDLQVQIFWHVRILLVVACLVLPQVMTGSLACGCGVRLFSACPFRALLNLVLPFPAHCPVCIVEHANHGICEKPADSPMVYGGAVTTFLGFVVIW